MRIVKSGKNGGAVNVDHVRVSPPVAHDLALGADVDDLVAADRDCVGDRARVIRLVDLRVVNDDVDRQAVVFALGAYDQSGNQRGAHDDDDQDAGEAGGHDVTAILAPPRGTVARRADRCTNCHRHG
jgi:hypothetical protein